MLTFYYLQSHPLHAPGLVLRPSSPASDLLLPLHPRLQNLVHPHGASVPLHREIVRQGRNVAVNLSVSKPPTHRLEHKLGDEKDEGEGRSDPDQGEHRDASVPGHPVQCGRGGVDSQCLTVLGHVHVHGLVKTGPSSVHVPLTKSQIQECE